jgi:peroxiredoxin
MLSAARRSWRIIVRRVLHLVLMLAAVAAVPHLSWGLFGSSEKPKVGDDAPRFNAPLLAGGDFDLGPYIGQKVILLDFWSIYCVSCVQEMPKLVDIHNRYKDQGLMTVGVDLDSFGTKRVVKFVKGLDFKVTYPIVVDKRREVAARYGVSVLPTTIVIDRGGKVFYHHVGYAPGDEVEIEEKVKHALNSGA